MMVLMKIGEAQILSNLIKDVVTFAYQGTGVVRNIRNLGDRITSRAYKAKDGTKHDFCRYITFQVDLDPIAMNKLFEILKLHKDTLNTYVHIRKNKDYYKDILDKEYFKKFETFEIDPELKSKVMQQTLASEIASKLIRNIPKELLMNKDETGDYNLRFDIKDTIKNDVLKQKQEDNRI